MGATSSKSVYKYASEAGIYAGLWLCALAACFLFSLRLPILNWCMFPLILGLPLCLAWLMRRLVISEPQYATFSSLWLFGIYTMIFGSLICALFSAVVLIYVEPGFLTRYLTEAIRAAENSPDADQLASHTQLLKEAIKSGMIPSPMNFVTSMMWASAFTGSIVSMFLAWPISSRLKRRGISG